MILIPCCPARRRARKEAPATQAAGRAACPIPGGATDLAARPPGAQALSDLLDRKPHLLRLLAEQLLPPPIAAIAPAVRLGIDLASLRTVEDVRRVLSMALAAVARGDIAPDEAAHIAERAEVRLRAARRVARLMRRPAHQTNSVRTPVG